VKASEKAPAPEPTADTDLSAPLLEACQKLLDADPFKVWQARDLVKALRESGVPVSRWVGMHYKILPILTNAKLIEFEGDGFRAAVRPAPAGGEKEE
jgi:hypothetical protein